jgi:plasmid stabilization system protein ParE
VSGQAYDVEWTRAARRDLEEIAEYLCQHSRVAALRLVERIEEKAQALHAFPYRGRVPPELLRFRVEIYHELQISPYRLIYRVYETRVVVLGVFDGRRDLEEILIGRLLSS